MKKLGKNIVKFSLFLFLVSCFLIMFNRIQIKPTKSELNIIKNTLGNINIANSSDIIKVQNLVMQEIGIEFLGKDEIDVEKVFIKKKGLCYDRSLILQKIFINSNIPVRPVFLYYYYDRTKEVSTLSFFSKDINSHSIFEFYFEDQWYVCRTNTYMKKLQTLEEYLKSSDTNLPLNVKFIRHLSNRNSRFIYPSWIPDIY